MGCCLHQVMLCEDSKINQETGRGQNDLPSLGRGWPNVSIKDVFLFIVITGYFSNDSVPESLMQ